MELTPKAQAVEQIKQANSVLILTHANPDGDAIGSAIALKLAIEKLQKKVDLLFSGDISDVFSFLPGSDTPKNELAVSNDIIITIDTRNSGEELKLGYKKLTNERRVKIVITPPVGSLLPEDITIERSLPKYDVIVILDCGTIERLGSLKGDILDLLYEVPTISIDHHVDNAHFAKINWVDITATSTAEILVSLLESLSRDEPLLDADIATALLTGIMSDTGSFQYSSTTPKSLTVAAQLVAAGARQQEIVEKLFRTISMRRLKLLGKMLAKLQLDEERFLWTTITKEDLTAVGAEPGEVTGLVNELQKSVGEADFALLLSDRDGTIYGSFRSLHPTYNVSELAHLFGGGGHIKAAAFQFEGTIAARQTEILDKIRRFQADRRAAAQPTTPNTSKVPAES